MHSRQFRTNDLPQKLVFYRRKRIKTVLISTRKSISFQDLLAQTDRSVGGCTSSSVVIVSVVGVWTLSHEFALFTWRVHIYFWISYQFTFNFSTVKAIQTFFFSKTDKICNKQQINTFPFILLKQKFDWLSSEFFGLRMLNVLFWANLNFCSFHLLLLNALQNFCLTICRSLDS